MPLFYFDTHDGDRHVHDDEGLLHADRQAARVTALAALSDMARDVLTTGGDERDLTASVRDEGGRVVFMATLSLAARWFD